MRLSRSLALLLLPLSGLAHADTPLVTGSAAPYKQGQQYQVVLPAQPVSIQPGQIEVVGLDR